VFVDPESKVEYFVDRKALHATAKKTVPLMYKRRPDGRFEACSYKQAKSGADQHQHPRIGEVLETLDYHSNPHETFAIEVKGCRLLTVRVTYAAPTEDALLRSPKLNSDYAAFSEGRFRRASNAMAAADLVSSVLAPGRHAAIPILSRMPSKFEQDVRTLSFIYRDGYTRGVEELVHGLSHGLADEWAARDALKWQHWSGHNTSAPEEWKYVLGAARRDHTYEGRDVGNDGVTLEQFLQRINSDQSMRFRQRSAQFEGYGKLHTRRHASLYLSGGDDGAKTQRAHTRRYAPTPPRGVGGERADELRSEAEPSAHRRDGLRRSGRGSSTEPAGGSVTDGARKGEHQLTLEEVIAIRLYTGPGYAPINSWLREVTALPAEPPAHAPRWGAWTPERGRMAPEQARRSAALDVTSSFGCTVGHLVRALHKIAALNTEDENQCTLYRGLRGTLPGRFWIPDDLGIVCATDTAFLSTSSDEVSLPPERGAYLPYQLTY
jgi:hypothetical protein